MGQYDRRAGGEIYLIEDEQQVATLAVRNPDFKAVLCHPDHPVHGRYRQGH